MTEPTEEPVRVLVVEDHAMMRESICSLLERQPDFQVCGTARSFDEALDLVGDVDVDLVLVDVSLPDASGIDLVREMLRRQPDLVTLMLSGHQESIYVSQAFAAGAGGYILKGQGTEIPGAVRRVLSGERYLSPGLSASSDR